MLVCAKDQTRYNHVMKKIYTGRGDDGFTNLLGKGRVPKSDLQPEAYGSVDEASAALGLARSLASAEEISAIVVQVQRDLQDLMAELAASPDAVERFRRLDQERISWLEGWIDLLGEQVSIPNDFILAGDSSRGAAFDLARCIVRRAERAVARLHFEGEIQYPHPLVYLNRLSSLCFLLATMENQRSGSGGFLMSRDSSE